MEKIRVTDDEIVVDSMILASRGEIPPALPSFGRNLVPYFCPNGSTDPTEEDINHATDLDAYRRGGASILDIPEPESSKEPVKGDPGCDGAGGLEGIIQKGKVGKSRSMTISEPLKVRKRGVAAKGRQKVPPKVPPKVPGHRSEEVSSPTSPLDDAPVLTASSDSDITDSEVQPSSGTAFLAQGPTWQQEHLQRSSSKPKKKTARRSLPLSNEESLPASKYVQNPRDSLPFSSASHETLAPDMLLKARQTSMPGPAGSPPGPRAGLPERFAGAAFHNSPAPSCLPLPTFAYQKTRDSTARLNLFPSPPREPPPPQARSSPPPPVPASQDLQTAAAVLSSPVPGPQLLRASSVPSEPEVMQASRDLATLKLRELLKLGAPSPVQEQSHSHVATRDLRRMLQLA